MDLSCRDAWVTLASPAFDALVEFYRQFLGCDPHPFIPDRYAEFQLPGLRLGIFAPRGEHQSEFDQPQGSAMSLCLEVGDLEAAIARLSALGYPPPGPILTATHGREIYGYDPDGNRLILHRAP